MIVKISIFIYNSFKSHKFSLFELQLNINPKLPMMSNNNISILLGITNPNRLIINNQPPPAI